MTGDGLADNDDTFVAVKRLLGYERHEPFADRLAACTVLQDALPPAVFALFPGAPPDAVLEKVLRQVVGQPEDRVAMKVVATYFEWEKPSHAEVLAVAKLVLTRIRDIGPDPSDEHKQAHVDELMANVKVRDGLASKLLEPLREPKEKRGRGIREQVTERLMRAFNLFITDSARIGLLMDAAAPQVVPAAASPSSRPQPEDLGNSDSSPPPTDPAIMTLESELLYLIDRYGVRRLSVTRTFRVNTGSLDELHTYFNSGFKDGLFEFVGEYGCEDRATFETTGWGTYQGRVQLTRTVREEELHTVKYSLERVAEVGLEDLTTCLLFPNHRYDFTARMRILVIFERSKRPKSVWHVTEIDPRRIPGKFVTANQLLMDESGAVEWHIEEMQPEMYYGLCWDF